MGGLRVGNAPCSWGTLEFEEAKGEQIGYSRMLDELAETGYTGTELGDWGFMPTDPAVLRAELDRRGLVMLGAFVPVALKDRSAHEAGAANAVKTARLLSAVASDPKPYLVLADNNGSVAERTRNAGRITADLGLSPDEWKVAAAGANQVARAVFDATGLRTVFHHHCAGYVETPDEIARLLELTDAEKLGLVFDCGHFAYGAGHCDVLKAWNGSRSASGTSTEGLSAGCRRARRAADGTTSKPCGMRFSEWARAAWIFGRAALAEARGYVGYTLEEQDVSRMGTPKESARRNREYLRSIESNYA
jgi:inosose dehydratase